MNRQAIARELVKLAKSLVGQKRITKATAKAVLKKLKLLDKVEVNSEDVEFWPENFNPDDWHKGRRMAEKAAKAFSKAMGGLTIWSNQSYFRVRYKGEFIDMGDPNDPSSRWNY